MEEPKVFPDDMHTAEMHVRGVSANKLKAIAEVFPTVGSLRSLLLQDGRKLVSELYCIPGISIVTIRALRDALGTARTGRRKRALKMYVDEESCMEVGMRSSEDVGQRLVALRKALGLGQNAFAEKIGITQGTLSVLENGKRDLEVRTALAIKDAYHASLDWLYDGDDSSLSHALAAKVRSTEPEKLQQ